MLEEIESQLVKYLSLGGGLVISLVIKDLLTSFAKGLSFYIDRNFHEGDEILIDDKEAVIIKIGFIRTIFRMKEDGNWRYVHNSRISWLKLGKKIGE